MTENALIAAIGEATAQARKNSAGGGTQAEALSNCLLAELNTLREPADPTKGLKPLEIWLRATVADLTLGQSEIDQLKAFYETLASVSNSDGTVQERVVGAIGFLLCCRSADHAQTLKTRRNSSASINTEADVAAARAESNAYLANPAVRKWIASYYAVEHIDIVRQGVTAKMIASGTTSYVVHFTKPTEFVLKLVKPHFMAIPLIREQTSSYGRLLEADASSNNLLPSVKAVGSSYIAMEYVYGENLTDFMAAGKLDTMTIAERRDLLYGIIGNLELLREPHLDLSPGNIMVEALVAGVDKSRRFKVRLIDFGYNYLLREGLSGIPVRNDIVRYSAPEMTAGSLQGSIKADLYSLGILLLDIMRTSPRAADLSVQLDRVWQAQPQLAALAEELIASDPSHRATWADGLIQADTYRVLKQRLERDELVSKLLEEKLKPVGALADLSAPFKELKKVIQDYPTLSQLSKDDPPSADAKYLYWWRAAVSVILLFFLAVCGTALFGTLELDSLKPTEFTIHELIKRWDIGVAKLTALRGNPESQAVLAGRVMALTIILVVGKYYSGIFSSITTRSSRVPYARTAEITIRSTPFGVGLLCVSTAVWFPTLWFVTSLFGPLITAANNYSVLRFCQNVRRQASERVIVGNLETTDIARFDELFKRWWRGMIYTGLLIFAVGWLLRAGVIVDEAFLGLALAFLCYAALYRWASTDMSSMMRGGIRRYTKVAERLQAP